MGRRSDHSRDELYEIALLAARGIAEEFGLNGLTMRRIAGRIGYSHGTLYNVFDDLDDLIMQLNGRTLDYLYEVLATATGDDDSEAGMLALAHGYIAFTRAHPKLWALLFEYHLPGDKPLPDWHHRKIARLLSLTDECLVPFFGPGHEAERIHTSRVLWSCLHGLCSLEAGKKLIPGETAEAMASSLITNYLAGLRGSGATTDN